ncbi:hypothetical protein NQ318_018428 [Aromia moschata]|uniref:Uncharacterized protein n=1 Tax=Aromia moschata TaxID=1265417 RepID=A0AAV8XGN9_9CUCU|nr:hypothetical protein NQ318_018428 [Aromia moschata]
MKNTGVNIQAKVEADVDRLHQIQVILEIGEEENSLVVDREAKAGRNIPDQDDQVAALLHTVLQSPKHTSLLLKINFAIEIIRDLHQNLEPNTGLVDLDQVPVHPAVIEVEKLQKASTSKNGSEITQNTKVRNNSPDCVIVDSDVLNEINEDKFAPKQFTSSKSKVPDNIVIDLKKNTIKVPEVEPLEPDSIFHHNLFLNEEARMEKWIKELYSYRQKALQQGLRTNC